MLPDAGLKKEYWFTMYFDSQMKSTRVRNWPRVRLKRSRSKYLLSALIFVAVLSVYFYWFHKRLTGSDKAKRRSSYNLGSRKQFYKSAAAAASNVSSWGATKVRSVQEGVTLIFREFEQFDNDVYESVESFLRLVENVDVLVVADKLPYPPLRLPQVPNVRLLVLQPSPEKDPSAFKAEYHVFTPYVLFVPDSVRMSGTSQIEEMMNAIQSYEPNSIVVSGMADDKTLTCLNLAVDLLKWTLHYGIDESNGDVGENGWRLGGKCDAVTKPHVLLMRTEQLFNLTNPFARPFYRAIYIQTSLRKWKVRIVDAKSEFRPGRELFASSHLRWKRDTAQKAQLQSLYANFKIKKVVLANGKVEWYGCTKQSSRCFGSVVDSMPSYLYQGKWTPPCCLEALRKTARHVLGILHDSKIRHWLEGGSLLGAARNGDIIPWDYDVDVGMYLDDLSKCPQLEKAASRPFVDEHGFVWEKATEGDFFRVQYSKINHLHVDIFPFYSKNGIMTKNTWFKTHRQDMEFPEQFLRPFSTIKFVGILASAPNNIRDFLELKFGEGAIETEEYPNSKKLAMSMSGS